MLITNFHLPYPADLRDIFERRMKESVHAFVGLIGIPYIRKDNRVVIGGEEVICHSKFHLSLHTREALTARGLAKSFNLVRYDFDEQAILKRLCSLSMQATRYERAQEHAQMEANIERLDRNVEERKQGLIIIPSIYH